MTPQLQQAIKLLQLSNMELAAFVEAELERNPLLERDESDETGGAQGEAAGGSEPIGRRQAGGERRTPETLPTRAKARRPAATTANGSTSRPRPRRRGRGSRYRAARCFSRSRDGFAAGALKESSWASLGQGTAPRRRRAPNLEAYVAEERTLKDHLTDQLVLAFADPAMRLIGHHLIDMTDEAGYLQGDLAGLGELLGAPLDLVEETLRVMQGFEPCGVFARDLARMPHAAAEGAGPLRPGHGGVDRAISTCLPCTISPR